jgi:hypothetical protein
MCGSNYLLQENKMEAIEQTWTIHDDVLMQEEAAEPGIPTAASKEKRFRWDKDEKVNNLIRCLANYKSQSEFNNCDFNANKVKQYEEVCVAMAKIYHKDPSQFGPVSVLSNPLIGVSDALLTEEQKREKVKLKKQQDEDKKFIKRGYQRIHEKLKDIRQNFSIAITSGRRSGSGKVVLEFYDELVQIWGGSPATEPLSCGTSTETVNSLEQSILDNMNQEDKDFDHDDPAIMNVSKSYLNVSFFLYMSHIF